MDSDQAHKSIERLLEKVKHCDVRSQRELYDLLVLKMYNTAFRILKNKEDTQDCLQVGFSNLFKYINQFDSKKGTFSTWSTRIFINESLRILKQRKLEFEEISDGLEFSNNQWSPIEDLQAEYIICLINELPDQMRVIFNLYEIEGYSHKEIAKILHIAESSSRTYLMRAKMKLRQFLEPEKVPLETTEISLLKINDVEDEK